LPTSAGQGAWLALLLPGALSLTLAVLTARTLQIALAGKPFSQASQK
jgi:hypothetical protein